MPLAHLIKFFERMRGALMAAPTRLEPVMKIPHAAPRTERPIARPVPMKAHAYGEMPFSSSPHPKNISSVISVCTAWQTGKQAGRRACGWMPAERDAGRHRMLGGTSARRIGPGHALPAQRGETRLWVPGAAALRSSRRDVPGAYGSHIRCTGAERPVRRGCPVLASGCDPD